MLVNLNNNYYIIHFNCNRLFLLYLISKELLSKIKWAIFCLVITNYMICGKRCVQVKNSGQAVIRIKFYKIHIFFLREYLIF